jgi:hypothetical protein
VTDLFAVTDGWKARKRWLRMMEAIVNDIMSRGILSKHAMSYAKVELVSQQSGDVEAQAGIAVAGLREQRRRV